MGPFERALADHPAPRRLGDLELSYRPSMLIGRAEGRSGWVGSTLAPFLGAVGLGGAVLAVALGASAALALALAALGGAGLAGQALARRRTRAFVADFATHRLRLDFVTPFAGQPRTVVVPFEWVRAVDLFPQAGGVSCLTVDFLPAEASPERWREVLAASITQGELELAERLQRILAGAFGLGAPPPDSPALTG